ncbi:AAA family ATPase [Actinoallomurus sp. CA-150999]|uniref:AAA family ATPase n=1 Tax=Actinoallomurus sp. CA-150999 TaxID=3239887 RepID=UPI003D923487
MSQTNPRAFPTIADAARASGPPGEQLRHIVVEPGNYRSDALRYWGNAVITAAGGPGTVTVNCNGNYTLRVEGHVTLRGLTLHNWNVDGNVLEAVGGTLIVEQCELVSKSSRAISVWDGAELFVRHSRVHGGGIVYSDSAGLVEHTEVFDADLCGIAIRNASRVTVRDCRVQRAGEHGIWVAEGSTPLIERCEVEGSKSASILAQGHAKATVRDSRLRASGQCSLVVRDNASATAEECLITGSGAEGVWVTANGTLTARRVSIEDGKRHGALVDESSTADFEDCDIMQSVNCGLAVSGSGTARFTGGTITKSQFGASAANEGVLTLDRAKVSHNKSIGVAVDPGARVVLRDCTIMGNAGQGIVTADGAHVRMERVKSEANGADDILGIEIGAPADSRAATTATPAAPGAAAPETADTAPELSVDELLAELTAMVGLAEVKREIGKLVGLLRIAEQRRQAGLPSGPSIGRHMVFAGAPGTGKTTVARLYGRLLAALGVVPSGQFTEVSRGELVGQVLGETTQKTTAVFNKALGGVLFIDEAYTLSRRFGTGTDFGQEAIDALVKLMEDHRDEIVVIVAGYSAEMREFLTANPGLKSRISRTIEFENYSPAELTSITETLAEQYGFRLTGQAQEALVAHFQRVRRDETFGNGREARRVFEAAVEQQALRLSGQDGPASSEDLTLLLPEDFDGVVDNGLSARLGAVRDAGQLQAVLDRLSAMIGLEEVKSQVRDTIDLIAATRRRQQEGLGATPISSHLIFSGPPGTGKTTVARLYGELLAALGVLARGHFVEASRGDLVGQYLGHTTQKATATFNEARGGVLFIDEVYALARQFGANTDFGQEAIDTLVKLMEDHREEVVVIVAGYTDEMNDFLAANPGLASRFSRTIAFAPYGPDELVDIFISIAESSGFEVPASTRSAVHDHVTGQTERFDQGNGREIRKLFEAAQTAHARRIAQLERSGTQATRDQLQTLLPADVEEAR